MHVKIFPFIPGPKNGASEQERFPFLFGKTHNVKLASLIILRFLTNGMISRVRRCMLWWLQQSNIKGRRPYGFWEHGWDRQMRSQNHDIVREVITGAISKGVTVESYRNTDEASDDD